MWLDYGREVAIVMVMGPRGARASGKPQASTRGFDWPLKKRSKKNVLVVNLYSAFYSCLAGIIYGGKQLHLFRDSLVWPLRWQAWIT